MAGSGGKGRGQDDWNAADWPDPEWEGGESPSPERRPPIENRTPRREHGRADAGPEVEADLGKVIDDPLFHAFPTQRGARKGASPGLPRPRLPAPRRSGLSLGQKFLLWVAFAVGTGLSFGVGLVVGASGGLELPAWPILKILVPEKPTQETLEALGPEPSAEGVIAFGDRGRVPSKSEEDLGPLEEGPAPPADTTGEGPGVKEAGASSRPEGGAPPAGQTARPATAPRAVPKPVPQEAEKAAEAEPPPKAPVVAAKKRGPEEEKGEAAAEEPASEMTFYDTTTEKRELPGLEEAVVKPAAKPESPQVRAAEEAPTGGDILSRRRQEEAARSPAPASRPEETASPSGAALLARRLGAPESSLPGLGMGGPEEAASSSFTVQVATVPDRAEAQALVDRLKAKGYDARVDPLRQPGTATLYRVRVGRYATEEAARRELERIRPEPGMHPFIRIE
jgi:DedD protein